VFEGPKESVENIGWSMYSDLTVQKAALLDIRILKCDRNSENLLVTGWEKGLSKELLRERLKLIPIDHGYALPQELQIYGVDWSWMSAFQVRAPVHPEIKAYLKTLNFDTIASKLHKHLPAECLYLLRIVHNLVVDGVAAGLTLFEIANLIVRDDFDPDRPSKLEEALHNATENAFRAIEIKTVRRAPGYVAWRRAVGALCKASSSLLGRSGSKSSRTIKLAISNNVKPAATPSTTKLCTILNRYKHSAGKCLCSLDAIVSKFNVLRYALISGCTGARTWNALIHDQSTPYICNSCGNAYP
jgi:hypothetical protein